MIKVVFLRHGQSTWNQQNRFTGWTDVELSEQGLDEARRAGALLRNSGYQFDHAFTSVLKRSIRTLWIVQEALDALWLPVHKDWRLNERHYGALQGMNKAEIAEHYGAEQMQAWRRSYSVRPPALTASDPRLPASDPRYADIPYGRLPSTESLADTLQRALACWQDAILPAIRAGRRVIVAAHGNTLRAFVKHLEGVSDEQIVKVEIPTGVPLVYEFDDGMNVLARYYLDDREPAKALAVG